MIEQIEINGELIKYRITRKNVKNINLRINHDEIIEISANKWVSRELIQGVLIKKTPWIKKSMEKIRERKEDKRELLWNEIMELGKVKKITIFEGKERIITKDCEIYIYQDDINDRNLTNKILKKHEKTLATEVFNGLNDDFYEEFSSIFKEKAVIKIRKMKRYGTCYIKRNLIILNINLIKAPISCIQSVLAHEYVHFLIGNHSKAFYKKLYEIFPTYNDCRKVLEKNIYM